MTCAPMSPLRTAQDVDTAREAVLGKYFTGRSRRSGMVALNARRDAEHSSGGGYGLGFRRSLVLSVRAQANPFGAAAGRSCVLVRLCKRRAGLRQGAPAW